MKKIILVVFVLLLIQGYRTAHDGGIFRDVSQPINFANCEAMEGPIGAEDMSIDHIAGIAYIAADSRQPQLHADGGYLDENYETAKQAYPNGGIWLLDLKDPKSQAVKVDIKMDGAFHPHGMSLRFSNKLSPQGGRAIELYVINHKNIKHNEVDVFSILPSGEMVLRKRISYPGLKTPNDLVVTGKDQFFVSNDHGSPRSSIMEVLENYVGLPLASVSYFDGQKEHRIIEGLRYPNGITISADKKTLYVAQTTPHLVSRYDRGSSMEDWTLRDSIDVNSGVDNLEWAEDGSLLVGAHPKLLKFVAHSKDTSKLSPSEVISIDVSDGKKMTFKSLYLNDGSAISGSSVAVRFNNQMLVGPVLDDHFLRCKHAQ